MYTPRFMYGMQVGQKVTICIHLDSCTVCRQDRKSQYVYTQIHVRYVGRTESHNMYTPRFMYRYVYTQIHVRQDRKSQYVYTQIHVRYVGRTESHNMYTPRFMYGMYMQVGQKVTICIHLDSCTVCRQDRKSQYVYTQIHVRYVGRTESHNMYTPRFMYGMYVGRTESHNMYTPRFMYGMQVGQKVTICIHLDSCTVCRQDRKSQYVYTQIHVRYVGRTSQYVYTQIRRMQVGQKVTICIHLDSCTVCRQDRKSQYVYTQIHVRYVDRTESHNMYTPRFMYGMYMQQDRKSQYVYTQIHVRYVHVGRTESHNMHTPRFMYGMKVGQVYTQIHVHVGKVTICIHLDSCTVCRQDKTSQYVYTQIHVGQKFTICIHLDSCTVCRQDRKSQYVYTQIHVRYVGRTESHNMYTPRFMYGMYMQVGQKVTICIHLDSCTVCRQDRKSQYVYTQIHVRYVHVGRTESHNMYTPRFMYGMQVGQKVTICIHLDSCTVCRQDRKSQYVYTQIHVRYVGRTESHNMYTPRFMYGMYMQVGQKVTICIHLDSCTVCRQDRKSQYVYSQIHVRYVVRTESHNMYTPRFMYGMYMQVGQKVTICIHLDSCTVCRQDRKSQYVYTQIHVRYVGRTKSHNMYTPRFMYGMQVGQKVTICIHLDSCTVCRQDRKSQYVYTQIHVRYVGRTESHNMYTPRFMYGMYMQVGQKVTICIHLDSCTVCRQDRKSQYVYTQIHVRYVHVGRTESHNMYTRRFMYGMQVGQKVTICIHLDSCTVCRQDRKSQYVYTQIHVRYVGRTESHNMYTPRFMYVCTCRQDRKSQYVYTQIHVRYVGRTESHNMYTPRFMYGMYMQVGQKVTICIHLDSCTVCRQDRKSQYVYTQIHVRYVGRIESHNMYTPRFMYGMQVGQKVTICIHLDSCTVWTCRQDRKSQYAYTQIHVCTYVGRTESHNMYTPRFMYGMQVGQKVTICIHLDSCTVCRQDRKSQYVYTQIHVRYVHVGRTESHNMHTPRFMYGMQVGQKVTICIHLDSCTVCRQDRKSQYVYTQIPVRYVGRKKVTICIHLDSCTVCRQDRKSQYVYTQIHVRYVHVGRTESHNMHTPKFMYGMQVGQKVTICIHLDSCTVCRQDRKSQYVYTQIQVGMQVGQKVTICIHLDSCTVCRQDRKSQYVYTQIHVRYVHVGRKKSQYVYTQIHVRYVGRTKSHNMYTPRFMYGMQVGQKVTICIHLDSCTVCRQDRKSQYAYTQIHVRYVGRTESHNMYTPRFMYGMQVGQKVTICIHLDSCTVCTCRQDRKSQYVYTQIHVRYVGRTESHNMYTPRFMYGMYMQVGQKVTICIHLDSCTESMYTYIHVRQDRKSQYVYTQIHVRYVGRTESHNMYTPRFMYGMQVGQKVTICIHLDSCTVCRQDRNSQYVYTQIHVRYVGRTESHNMYTPRFMYGMQVGQKVTICIHLDSCTVCTCRQDRKSQYVYTQIHVRYVGRTESHNMYTPRFMYGMQVGQKVTICIHLDSCTVCRQDKKSQYVYTQIHVRYVHVGRTESHNMYTPRFMYGMQVGQKVTICIHLDSCTVCSQDRKSQYVYTQIHVRYVHVGRTESHNMYTPRFVYGMQVGQKVTICIHLDSCTVCRQDKMSQYVYTQIHVRYVGRTESHNMYTPRFMYGMQVGQKVTICIHLD